MTNADDNSDTKSDQNSVDPNEANNNSCKASIHSTGSYICIDSTTSEPPQHALDEETNLSEDQTEPDDIELPEMETNVPMLCQSRRVSVTPSDCIPQMGGKTYIMHVQTITKHDEEKGLVYNHDEARVLATVMTTYNKNMEHVVEQHGQQHVVTYSMKTGINKFGD